MAELKPCPFCGGEARRYYGNYDMHGIVCKKCTAKIYGYANKVGATRAWNKRTPKETHEKHTETHDSTPKERGGEK